ncbi:MAG TPA: hypothetical protein PLB62_14585, partial [Candidatus Sumerlaeota bacterium]|nr:hypothetical protein [Candidatus Sumerlaeota bacterium]
PPLSTPTLTPTPTPTPEPSPTPANVVWTQTPGRKYLYDTPSWRDEKPSVNFIVADDFELRYNRAITGFRWWGSYIGWMEDDDSLIEDVPEPKILEFEIRLYEYKEDGFPQPDTLIKEYRTSKFRETPYSVIPCWYMKKWEHEFLYEIHLPEPWEIRPGGYYFIRIQAVYEGESGSTVTYPWGWLNVSTLWNAAAVSKDVEDGKWAPLHFPEIHPFKGRAMDMAFEILAEVPPTPTPTPTPTPFPGYVLKVSASSGGKVEVFPDLPAHDAGSTVTLTPLNNTGHHFVYWKGDVPETDLTRSPLILTMDGDKKIQGIFTINQYDLDVSNNHGTVVVNPDYVDYDYGTSVTLTAQFDPGFNFKQWAGDVPAGEEKKNPLDIIMDQNRVIRAEGTEPAPANTGFLAY